MNRNHIWKAEKAYIISLLVDYPDYEKHVERRNFELRHPIGEIDENVGGGRAQFKQNDTVDRMLIRIDEDNYLNALRHEHYIIRACFEDADEDVQKICQELYFKKSKNKKYQTIADMCNAGALLLSKTVAYDKFDEFMREIAKQLGLR